MHVSNVHSTAYGLAIGIMITDLLPFIAMIQNLLSASYSSNINARQLAAASI